MVGYKLNVFVFKVEALEKLLNYDKETWFHFVTQYDYDQFNDDTLKRRFDNMALLGIAAMTNESLSEYNGIVSGMTGVYGAGKVCPYQNQKCDLVTEGLTLEPGISQVIDNPSQHTWQELEYYWQSWRDVSGKLIKSQFQRYIELNEVAAKANGKCANGFFGRLFKFFK